MSVRVTIEQMICEGSCTMLEDLSKAELVRRARSLNQKAIEYRLSGDKGQMIWASDMCNRRDEFIRRARSI